MRRKTREIQLGSVKVGGENSISVQSMAKTDTRNVDATVQQILELEAAGCEIVRVAVPDKEAGFVLGRIKNQIHIPLVADIHFDYRLALLAIEQGVDGLRINPGNIGKIENLSAVVKQAKDFHIPIRIGVNAGSLEKDLLKKYGGPTSYGMVESALRHIRTLEKMGFYEIKVSLKAADVPRTVASYRLMSKEVDYPLHLGITEAGRPFSGTIKSAVGIGILLNEGIGDTIRVSLTGEPTEEVRVGYEILRALGIRKRGVEIISCPTCGRCEIDLIPLVREAERRLASIAKPLQVAMMGCLVNGPGEGREADIGVCGGRGEALLFKKGRVVRKIKLEEMVDVLIAEIHTMI